MSFNYPITLNISGKKCTVIGGGEVAERKVKSLISSGALVHLVSPQANESLRKLAMTKKIVWVEEKFSPEMVSDSSLVIAATNNSKTNKLIAKHCQDNNILVNVVDSINDSNFIVNSFFKRGDLLIAISTNGKSPALSKKIKTEIEKLYGYEYAVLLEILGEIREEAKIKISNEEKRNMFLKTIIETDILDLIRAGCADKARERVIQCLLSY